MQPSGSDRSHRQFLVFDFVRKSNSLRLFAHYPAPRCRGRDSRVRSFKRKNTRPTRSFQILRSLSLEPCDRWHAIATFSMPQLSGRHPIGQSHLSPNDLEVSGKGTLYLPQISNQHRRKSTQPRGFRLAWEFHAFRAPPPHIYSFGNRPIKKHQVYNME